MLMRPARDRLETISRWNYELQIRIFHRKNAVNSTIGICNRAPSAEDPAGQAAKEKEDTHL